MTMGNKHIMVQGENVSILENNILLVTYKKFEMSERGGDDRGGYTVNDTTGDNALYRLYVWLSSLCNA